MPGVTPKKKPLGSSTRKSTPIKDEPKTKEKK